VSAERRNAFYGWLWMMLLAFAVKFAIDLVPESGVKHLFMFPSAKAAALYWSVPLIDSPLSFVARGVTIVVTRACSATDFFSLAFALLAFRMRIRRLWLRIPAALAIAWCAAVFANATRLVMLVPIDEIFSAAQIPSIHMAIGISVFMPVFGILWFFSSLRKEVVYE